MVIRSYFSGRREVYSVVPSYVCGSIAALLETYYSFGMCESPDVQITQSLKTYEKDGNRLQDGLENSKKWADY